MNQLSFSHLTSEERSELLDHRLPRAKLAAALRHIAQCPSCATAARDEYDVAAAGRAVGQDLLARERSSVWSLRRRLLAIAAVLALAALGLAAWVAFLRKTEPVHIVLEDRWNRASDGAYARGELAMPEVLRALRPPAGSLRGAEGDRTKVRLWPAGLVVEDDRPEFRWETVPKASAYRVLLFRGATEIGDSGPLPLRSWRPERPLDRGVTYTWQVIAFLPGAELAIPAPPDRPALFQVLPRDREQALTSARRTYPGDRILLGLLYARFGVADGAATELGAAAAAHPENRRLQTLWQSVQKWQTSE